ncbi:MAG TPA: DUF2851 family protein [Dehalococcoidales bacterium]|nr:DUF2851 family protein [Dehalococcoidales bacterium]
MKSGFTEKELIRIWQRQLLNADGALTEDGQPLQIIHPGWLNDGGGPDFKDAVILIGQELVRGDIEVHLSPDGWFEHGHHLDVAYNRVILHVVMWADDGKPARLQNGGEAPTLVLSKYANIPVSQWSVVRSPSAVSTLPCRETVACLSKETMAQLLDKAGEERFLGKARRLQKDLFSLEAGQALYEGIMTALGYSRNKLPFLELARRLPLRRLEAKEDCSETEWLAQKQALLIGASGLLDASSVWLERALGKRQMRKMLKYAAVLTCPEALPRDAWHLVKVRPNNSPPVRLSAMSHLLQRYREMGLLEGLLNLVERAPPGRDGPKSLEAGLIVAENGVTLLGKERADEIIVNVLLPFTFVLSQTNPELGSKAREIYFLYPRLSANSVEAEMTERLGLSTGLVNSARRRRLNGSLVNSASRQQGLIHIYKNFCCQGKCNGCALGQL